MSVKPILFNTEMVRAILDGRKTCTRRVAKNVPDHTHRIEPVYENCRFQFDCFYSSYVVALDAYADFCMPCLPPYQQGDILYVRETWMRFECWNCEGDEAGNCAKEPHISVLEKQGGCYLYRATSEISGDARWHPSIHMPKEAARIWLKVTDVRVERLQEISEEGAEKEGCRESVDSKTKFRIADILNFYEVWDSTIKKSDLDRYGWKANPWVWVIDFERCEKPKEERKWKN